tara:strand:- start:216 stop:338 length:123 start_codon:yes stop_codon:yes gene_type:complete
MSQLPEITALQPRRKVCFDTQLGEANTSLMNDKVARISLM